MPENDTDKNWPPQQSPTKGERALEQAIRRIGEREQGGKNQGPIVAWSLHWLFEARKQLAMYEELLRKGDARWCAGFIGRCFLEAGIHVTPYWSAHVPTLLKRLLMRQEREGDWLVRRWPCEVERGDVVFFGDDLHHVDLLEVPDETTLFTVGGNTGLRTATEPPSNRVARMSRLLASADIHSIARAR